MKVAIAGLGSAANRAHLPALDRLGGRARLVGAADPDPDCLREASQRLEQVPLFSSGKEMLAQVDADVLLIATEPRSHASLIETGIEHGLHVVCEKPLAVERDEHEAITAACGRRPDLALVPVHQYRYSPPWASFRRWARSAARKGRPFALTVDLQRNGTDRHAASPWRADPAHAGGMFADAGVHFLALAWTLEERLEVLAASRRVEAGGERSAALLRLGSGVLKLQVWNGATARHTGLELQLQHATISWRDGLSSLQVGGRTLVRRRVEALSDRSHVDNLYLALYRDLARNLGSEAWRMQRTAEALGVSEVLVTLLERTPLEVGAAGS
jgi:predicted dehydrogenase